MRRVQIYDTTLRDGSQGEGISFSGADKLQLAYRLDEMGFDYIEGGYPLSNEKDAQFFAQARQKPFQHARLCAFGMTRRRGIAASEDLGMRALVDSGAPACTVVGKTSEFHVERVLQVSLEENLAMISDSVGFLRQSGREVIYDAEHFFDGWKASPAYALKTLRAAAEAGASLLVLCDTNGGSMPEEIAAITREVIQAAGVPVGIHCHNDCDLAVANSLAAIEAGAIQVQGTINGIGERCGNVDLISVIANLAVKKQGYEVLTPGGVVRLTELSRYTYELANMNFRSSQPFVGQSAFAHKGGMHVHAVAKATASYEHIPPEVVGNERRILVSELSGRSNIMALAERHNIRQDQQLASSILAEVVRLENRGYQFEAAEASFDLLVRKCAQTYQAKFERLSYHVNVDVDCQPSAKANPVESGATVTTEATVKIRVPYPDGTSAVRHEVAEGDGPVNALDAALRKALRDRYPNIDNLRLMDYRVRVINAVEGTAAAVRVVIESHDEHDTWGTVGVSENIIEASWLALVDSIEYKLLKDERTAGQ